LLADPPSNETIDVFYIKIKGKVLGVNLHSFLTSPVNADKWSASRLLYPREEFPGSHSVRGCVVCEDGLAVLDKR